MAIAPVFRAVATPQTGTDLTLSYSGSAGQLFLILGGSSGLPSSDTGVTDNGGNTWTKVESTPPSGTTGRRAFAYICLATSSFTTVTVAHDHLLQLTASLVEVTGFDSVTPLDTHGSASRASSTTPAAVTVTPTNSNALEIGIIQANTNLATTGVNVPTGYTDLTGYATQGPKIVYKVGPTAGTPDGPAFTLSVAQGSGMVTLIINAATAGIPISMSDSFGFSDSASIGVTLPLSDSWTETESLALQANQALADPATQTDSMVITVPIAMSDSSTFSESAAVGIGIPASDSATQSDSMTVGITVPLSDSSSFTDAMTVSVVGAATVVPPYQSTIVATPQTTQAYPPVVPYVGIPPMEVQNAITAGVVQIKRRAEIYESNAITPFGIANWDARLSTGSITVDGTRDERRMIDISLDNTDFALNMNPYGGMYYDKIIKVFWGVVYYPVSSTGVVSAYQKFWETQIGEFMIDTFDEDRFPNVQHITGRDYTKLCLQSDITQSETFDSTYPVEEILTGLAANAGVTKFRMPATGLFFKDDTTFDIGTSRWAIMVQVADSVGYEVFFTADGYLAMRPYQDPVLSPLVYTFEPGASNGTLITYKKSSDDSLIKNHTMVVGATVTDDSGISTTAYGEAVNDDPRSPTRRYRPDGTIHLGDRLDLFKSDYITSVADAQALAVQRLRVMGLEEFSVDFSSLIIPWIDANDIIQVINPNESVYTPVRFLFSNFAIPLGLGAMTGTAKRVTVVGTTSVTGAGS